MSITIRLIQEEKDLETVAKLAEKIWSRTYKEILSQEQMAYMLEMMYDLSVTTREVMDGVRFELICDGEKPIGFISYGPYADGVAKLHKLYLDYNYHGKGIGSMALRHVIGETRAAGYKFLRLNVNKQNKDAIRAYERNGFKLYEKVKVDIGGGFYMDDYIYQHAL